MPIFRKKQKYSIGTLGPIDIRREAIRSLGTDDTNRKLIEWTMGSNTPVFMANHPDHGSMLMIQSSSGARWVTPGSWVVRFTPMDFLCVSHVQFINDYEPVDARCV